MSDLKLKVAFWDYDRTRALADGTVKIDGVRFAPHSVKATPTTDTRMAPRSLWVHLD